MNTSFTKVAVHRISVPDLAALAALAAAIAAEARCGDLIALVGALGTGKTAFARKFLDARASLNGVSPPAEVPSPTFTLAQVYEVGADDVWHFDFYRISGPQECGELGFDDALSQGIVLVEWPDRLGFLLPADRLDLEMTIAEGETRLVTITGHGNWESRVPEIPSRSRAMPTL